MGDPRGRRTEARRVRASQNARLVVLVGLLVLGWVEAVQAAVRLPGPPGGWEDGAPAARSRADRWADAVEGRVLEVYGPGTTDEFEETLALIEVEGGLWPDAAAVPEQALIRQAAPALGVEEAPEEVDVVEPRGSGPRMVVGRWEHEGTTYRVALASSGPTHALLVLAVASDEDILYAPVFEEALGTLKGLAPPVEAFPHRGWRVGGFIGWAIFTALAWVVVAWRSEPSISALQHGRRVAFVCAVAALLATLAVYASLGDHQTQLLVAGLTREWIAAELALLGLGAALVAMAVAAALHGRQRPVQSAPSAGIFADRGRPLQMPLVDPEGVGRHEPRSRRPAHPDGPSQLEEAAPDTEASR